MFTLACFYPLMCNFVPSLQVSSIVALWQNLLEYDKLRVCSLPDIRAGWTQGGSVLPNRDRSSLQGWRV